MNFNFFRPQSRPENQWFSAGPASSYPDLGPHDGDLWRLRLCGGAGTKGLGLIRGCRVFRGPSAERPEPVEISQADPDDENEGDGEEQGKKEQTEDGDDIEDHGAATVVLLKDQVVVFQYRGKFHAIDHSCPHSTYPLSRGTPFDIEDFGVVLSAGITCPKHGWSFDLFTGTADRGGYQLSRWEVELRDCAWQDNANGAQLESSTKDKEVWVRRKQRIG